MGSHRTSERGSVIIMLFIFVVLFAALTFAVTKSFNLGSGTSNVVSEEKMRAAYIEIQDVVQAHRVAIQTMLSNGISIDAIDASDQNPGDFYDWTNADCTSDACHLYLPDGGGMKFYEFANLHPELAGAPQEPAFPAFPTALLWFWIGGKGTESADLAFTLNVTKDFCNFINRQIGVNVDVDSTIEFVNSGQALVANERINWGTMPHQWAAFMPGIAADHLSGQNQGCFLWKYSGGDPNSYRYFALLKAM